jgi:hypothetical protein
VLAPVRDLPARVSRAISNRLLWARSGRKRNGCIRGRDRGKLPFAQASESRGSELADLRQIRNLANHPKVAPWTEIARLMLDEQRQWWSASPTVM